MQKPPHKHTPEISIVVPMYNVEKYIETCIVSILNQTFENFELIVVDDCSTDRSAEIVRSFNDPRIKIYQQIKNSGESASRDLGLTVSNGKYVYFMDNDDVLLPNCLEIFYNAIEESGADVVHMSSWIETENEDFPYTSNVDVIKKSCLNSTPRFLSENLESRLQNEFINFGVGFTPWLQFYRREFLISNEIYFPAITRCGDTLHTLAGLCFARKIQVINEYGYVYRRHSNQTMKKSDEKQLRAGLESLPTTIEFLQELFASKKLISPVSKQFQNTIERFVITFFFELFICRPYASKLSVEDIDKILREVLSQPKMMNPEMIRIFTNIIASLLMQK